jgi:hypothetical protein
MFIDQFNRHFIIVLLVNGAGICEVGGIGEFEG